MLNGHSALSLSHPGALWLGLALVPVLLLYFLRMRFRRKAVGSTYIWRELVGATSGGDALKLRSVLLLLLQVAAILLAAFAAAGPSIDSRRLLKPGMAILVDVSASMATRDCPSAHDGQVVSRVEAAVEAAQKAIAGLGEDVPVMAFACSSSARPLLAEPSLDRNAASASLRGLAAGSEAFSEGSCADSISAWLARIPGSWEGVLYTDGGLDLGGRGISAAFGDSRRGSLRFVELGSSGASLGVTGLRLERAGSGQSRARFTLWNGWSSARRAKLSLARGKEEKGSLALDLAPGWSRASLDLNGDIEEGAYAIRIASEGGLPSAPGGAYYLSVSRRRPLSVLLVGRSDPFIKAALGYGGISYTSSSEFPASTAGADIVIADAAAVPAGSRCQLLVFGAPPPDAPVAAGGQASGQMLSADPEHPLARFVNWEGARLESGMAYAVKGQAQVLATAGGRPVLVAWESGGYRCLACGIDLARSDLGLKSAFPVLLENFFEWCVPRTDEQSAYTLVAGQGARRAEGQAFAASALELSRSGPTVLMTGREAGLFEWSDPSSASGSKSGFIAVNVPASEIDASPRALQAPAEATGPRAGAPEASALASTRETRSLPLTGWALLLLCLCLAGEWLAWKGSGARERLTRRIKARARA
jgi:hypothetical protein